MIFSFRFYGNIRQSSWAWYARRFALGIAIIMIPGPGLDNAPRLLAASPTQHRYGGDVELDKSLYDPQFPDMIEFAKAGVQQGIPLRKSLEIKQTVGPDTDLQQGIDQVAKNGGGVLLLRAGDYPLSATLEMRSNVVLRGARATKVRLISRLRSKKKVATIRFGEIENAGLEDLTITLGVPGREPIDRRHLRDGGWCGDCFKNDPYGMDDLYVQLVVLNGSQNCWVDGCALIQAGTDPIWVRGSHNTIRNCLIDRAFNKGELGNGYFDLRGDNNLVVGNTVRRIRHFAVQQGAKYNVVIHNLIEVDVNFHNQDGGHNLVEGNTILIPTWHGWGIFTTGGAKYGHKPPGPDNVFYSNKTDYRGTGPKFAGNRVFYSFKGFGEPVVAGPMPKKQTFYPVKVRR